MSDVAEEPCFSDDDSFVDSGIINRTSLIHTEITPDFGPLTMNDVEHNHGYKEIEGIEKRQLGDKSSDSTVEQENIRRATSRKRTRFMRQDNKQKSVSPKVLTEKQVETYEKFDEFVQWIMTKTLKQAGKVISEKYELFKKGQEG